MAKYEMISVYLGTKEIGADRKAALERVAADAGALAQTGAPSISVLLTMIADGDLVVRPSRKLAAARKASVDLTPVRQWMES